MVEVDVRKASNNIRHWKVTNKPPHNDPVTTSIPNLRSADKSSQSLTQLTIDVLDIYSHYPNPNPEGSTMTYYQNASARAKVEVNYIW